MARIGRFSNFLNRRSKLVLAYRNTFDSDYGEVVLRHLMKTGFVFDSTFVAGDSNQTSMNEGMRRLVLSIVRMLSIDDVKLAEIISQEEEDREDVGRRDRYTTDG